MNELDGVAKGEMNDLLTFVASVDLWFPNEGRTVALVGAKEDICGISNASTNITGDILTSTPVMAFILISTSSEYALPLQNT